VVVSIASLILDDSPRREGEDVAHTHTLAEAEAALPPILVHRDTMRVLDGMHRVQAAKLKGQSHIRARIFDGDEKAAFVKAVEANVSHGLPLTLGDRRAAAGRIIQFYPERSDRSIAVSTGLSATAVSAIRPTVEGASGRPAVRVGRDGRARPLNPAEGRQRAAAVIADRPETPLREVARSANVSLGTARDVRRRIQNGEDPVPYRLRHTGKGSRPAVADPAEVRTSARRRRAGPGGADKPPTSLLQRLKQDPSLKYSEQGRRTLRWLDARIIDPADWSGFVECVPGHCTYTIAELASGCARAWEQLAEEMWERTA
jgi:ParB-like chromosome segregation protein Spo0J